jgi:hypothetical protein
LFKIAPKHCFLQIHGTAILKKKVVVWQNCNIA